MAIAVCRELGEPDAKRVAMPGVGALVFKRRLDSAIIERLR